MKRILVKNDTKYFWYILEQKIHYILPYIILIIFKKWKLLNDNDNYIFPSSQVHNYQLSFPDSC